MSHTGFRTRCRSVSHPCLHTQPPCMPGAHINSSASDTRAPKRRTTLVPPIRVYIFDPHSATLGLSQHHAVNITGPHHQQHVHCLTQSWTSGGTHLVSLFWRHALGVCHLVSHSVTHPLSTQYPMISHTQGHSAEPLLPHCQGLSVTLGITLGPTSCPHPHPTRSCGQSCCPMSRLFPVVVLRVLSHCLFLQGFPVVRAPVRDTQPKAQELHPPPHPSRDLGPLYLPPSLLGPCGIPPHPIQSAWLLCVPGLVLNH